MQTSYVGMANLQPETDETHQGVEGESKLTTLEASGGKQHRQSHCHIIITIPPILPRPDEMIDFTEIKWRSCLTPFESSRSPSCL